MKSEQMTPMVFMQVLELDSKCKYGLLLEQFFI